MAAGDEILAWKKEAENQAPERRTDCPVCDWTLEEKSGVLHCPYCGWCERISRWRGKE